MHDPASGTEDPLRVLVVDADDRVRESLSGLLAIGRRLVVVGNAGQPGPALDLLAAESPDVVIVDPRLPEVAGGLAFMARVRARDPAVRIVVMSWNDGVEDPALAAASDAFIRKTFRPNDLIAAIIAASGRSA
jgi:DNA-binding NarL/FixJ family response regulator